MGVRKLLFILSILFIAPAAHASEIIVSAAASLTNPFSELKETFIKKNPKITLYMNFASSRNLLKQIEEGAPVNIFASADEFTMMMAETAELVYPNTARIFARNTLVLVVPIDSKNIPNLPKDLLSKEYEKIAIGNIASVPAGQYAKESLESEKLWDVLKPRFVYAGNIRQVLDYVARGEVDAGFVYATDAMSQKNKVRVVATLEGHQPILYPIALLKNSKNKKVAQEFLDFIFSDEGMAILSKHGFIKP